MKQKLSKKIAYWSGVIMVGVALGLAIQFVRAWTEPSAAPPNGNVGAPINTSANPQTKQGGLLLGSATPGGNKGQGTINADQVCIRGVCQTTWPSGSSSPCSSPAGAPGSVYNTCTGCYYCNMAPNLTCIYGML